MAKRPTLQAVAREAGVSVATVSRVFSGADPVAADKERRVREAAARLAYEPNRVAASLRKQKSDAIGIVLPGFSNPFFFELIAQAVEACAQGGYSVVVAGGQDPEVEAHRLIASRSVDGILLVGSRVAEPARLLGDPDVPVVCFDRRPPGLQCPLVVVDNRLGAAEITRHLYEAGCRNIAHIAGPRDVIASRARYEGFMRARQELGIEGDPYVACGDFTEESGCLAMEQILNQSKKEVDAVFAANDLMGIGALKAAKRHGINVPESMCVAGFDGITTGGYVTPGLTTYVQPIQAMAGCAVETVLSLVEKRRTQGELNVLLPGELLIRESTRGE